MFEDKEDEQSIKQLERLEQLYTLGGVNFDSVIIIDFGNSLKINILLPKGYNLLSSVYEYRLSLCTLLTHRTLLLFLGYRIQLPHHDFLEVFPQQQTDCHLLLGTYPPNFLIIFSVSEAYR